MCPSSDASSSKWLNDGLVTLIPKSTCPVICMAVTVAFALSIRMPFAGGRGRRIVADRRVLHGQRGVMRRDRGRVVDEVAVRDRRRRKVREVGLPTRRPVVQPVTVTLSSSTNPWSDTSNPSPPAVHVICDIASVAWWRSWSAGSLSTLSWTCWAASPPVSR